MHTFLVVACREVEDLLFSSLIFVVKEDLLFTVVEDLQFGILFVVAVD